LTNLSDLYRW